MSAGVGRPARSRKVGAKSQLMPIAVEVEPGLDVARASATRNGMRKRLFVHEPLVEQTVLAEKEALVARVDDHGVLAQAVGVQPVEQPPDVVVHALHAGQVVLHVALIFPVVQFLAGERLPDAIDFDLDFGRLGRSTSAPVPDPAVPAGGASLRSRRVRSRNTDCCCSRSASVRPA